MAQLQLERNGALLGVHGLVRSKSAWRERHCQRGNVTPSVQTSSFDWRPERRPAL